MRSSSFSIFFHHRLLLLLLLFCWPSLLQSFPLRPPPPPRTTGVVVSRLHAAIDLAEEVTTTADTDTTTNTNNDDDDWIQDAIEKNDVVVTPPTTTSTTTTTTVIRDLDGNPLTTDWLQQAMGLKNNKKVLSYSCPDDTVFRGLMSDACRIQLETTTTTTNDDDDDTTLSTTTTTTTTAFYKRICFTDLSHCREKLRTAPHKLTRDVHSYHVVAQWLQSAACRRLCETTQQQQQLQIPQCYHAELRPNTENPMESAFSFLLQDFSPDQGWYQQWLLDDPAHTEAALRTFATLHAFGWTGATWQTEDPAAATQLQNAIWPSGSYVQPTAQNTPTVDQCAIVAEEWERKKQKFAAELSHYPWWDTLGERLQSVATECGRLAHPFAPSTSDPTKTAADTVLLHQQYAKYKTITHGDPKQANLLFQRQQDDTSLHVGLIDFQWTGFGLAATDLAHCMTSSIHADQLVDGGEERLLHYYYYEQLVPLLVEYGAYASAQDVYDDYPYATMLEQYEIAVLDIARLMIAYTWNRFDEPVTRDDPAACARTMNKTSYNKSIPNIVWLLNRCDEILTRQWGV